MGDGIESCKSCSNSAGHRVMSFAGAASLQLQIVCLCRSILLTLSSHSVSVEADHQKPNFQGPESWSPPVWVLVASVGRPRPCARGGDANPSCRRCTKAKCGPQFQVPLASNGWIKHNDSTLKRFLLKKGSYVCQSRGPKRSIWCWFC